MRNGLLGIVAVMLLSGCALLSGESGSAGAQSELPQSNAVEVEPLPVPDYYPEGYSRRYQEDDFTTISVGPEVLVNVTDQVDLLYGNVEAEAVFEIVSPDRQNILWVEYPTAPNPTYKISLYLNNRDQAFAYVELERFGTRYLPPLTYDLSDGKLYGHEYRGRLFIDGFPFHWEGNEIIAFDNGKRFYNIVTEQWIEPEFPVIPEELREPNKDGEFYTSFNANWCSYNQETGKIAYVLTNGGYDSVYIFDTQTGQWDRAFTRPSFNIFNQYCVWLDSHRLLIHLVELKSEKKGWYLYDTDIGVASEYSWNTGKIDQYYFNGAYEHMVNISIYERNLLLDLRSKEVLLEAGKILFAINDRLFVMQEGKTVSIYDLYEMRRYVINTPITEVLGRYGGKCRSNFTLSSGNAGDPYYMVDMAVLESYVQGQ